MTPTFRGSWLWLFVAAAALIHCRKVESASLPNTNGETKTCSSENGGVCQEDDVLQHPHCVDRDERCSSMALQGKCDSHPSIMYELCPRSCDVCL
jgi:hypothetical protein